VLAVSPGLRNHHAAGRHRAGGLAVALPDRAGQRISCGNGAGGRRWYDWVFVAQGARRSPGPVHRLCVVAVNRARPANDTDGVLVQCVAWRLWLKSSIALS
jgi:hypothetical protein